jgi:hypothetical protein
MNIISFTNKHFNNNNQYLVVFVLLLFSQNSHSQQYGYNSFALAPEGLDVVAAFWEHQGVNVNPGGILFEDSKLKIDAFNLSYSKYFSVAGKTAQVNVAVPYVLIDGKTEFGFDGIPLPTDTNTNGFADPYIHFAMALIGGDSMTAAEFIENEGGLTVSGLVAVRVPLGTYDSEESFNSGQNRFEIRLGFPVVKSWGKPGKSTSVEFYPIVAFFTPNDDFQGQEVTQEHLYRFEVHATRDIIGGLALGADLNYITGGETAIDGVDNENRYSYLTGGFHASGRFTRKLGWGAIFSYPITADDSVDKAAWSRIIINYSF